MSIPVEQVDPYTRKFGGKPGRRSHRKGRPAAKIKPPATGPPAEEAPLTLSVPEAGKKYFGLGRNASYAAAERGEIPTIRFGKLIRVPVRALERMLDTARPKSEDAE